MLVDSGALLPDIGKVPVALVPLAVAVLAAQGLWHTVVLRATAESPGRRRLVFPGTPESAQAHAALRQQAVATFCGSFRRFPEEAPEDDQSRPAAGEVVADMLCHLRRWAYSAVQSLPDDRREQELLRLAFVLDLCRGSAGAWAFAPDRP